MFLNGLEIIKKINEDSSLHFKMREITSNCIYCTEAYVDVIIDDVKYKIVFDVDPFNAFISYTEQEAEQIINLLEKKCQEVLKIKRSQNNS